MLRHRPPFRLALQYAVRHPLTAIRVATGDPAGAMLVAARALPAPIRLPISRFVARAAERSLRAHGDHSIAATIAVLAHEAGDDRARAIEVAAGAGRTASRAGARRLAGLLVTLGGPAVASDVMAAQPATDHPHDRAVRGAIAAALGQYRPALELLAPPIPDRSRRLAGRITAELALLDPGWRPSSIGPGARGSANARGRSLHLLTNSLPYRQAGYTIRAQHVALSQLAAGLEPHMATRAGFPANAGVARAPASARLDGVPYHHIGPDLAPDTNVDRVAEETARGLLELVERLHPAVLHPTTNYVNGQVALAVGERTGLPVVYEVRGFLEETWLSGFDAAGDGAASAESAAASDRYVMTRAIETTLMARAAAVVTLSETMRADIVDRGVDPAKVVVVPNAVDVERFRPGPRDAALAAHLSIHDDEIVVGYISSLTSYEGIGHLIDAVALLVERGHRVRLLIVGDGAERARLVDHASRAGLVASGIATFTGTVPYADIERYYRTIDLFVVPRTNDRVARLCDAAQAIRGDGHGAAHPGQ